MDLPTTYNSNYLGFYQFISKNSLWLWRLLGFEGLIWILGLTYLAVVHSPDVTHFTICPLANLGFEFCPGCGLGNSIFYIFRGDLIASFRSHPLGIFALLIISFRIITIIKNNRRKYA